MKDELLETLLHREVLLKEQLAAVQKSIKLRRQQNTGMEETLGDTDIALGIKRFTAYANSRMKKQAVLTVISENPGISERELAQILVRDGLPLGATRAEANAIKSIRGYVASGVVVNRDGKLFLPEATHSQSL